MGIISILIAVVSLVFAACQTSVVGTSSTSQGIEGQYTFRGPGMFMDCTQVPPEEVEACEETNEPFATPIVDASIEARDVDNNIVTTTTTDFDGRFRVQLPPGEYLLCAEFCEGPLAVKEGEFTVYDLALFAP